MNEYCRLALTRVCFPGVFISSNDTYYPILDWLSRMGSLRQEANYTQNSLENVPFPCAQCGYEVYLSDLFFAL